MSLSTIAIMNSHRDAQIEQSPSSEEFLIVDGSTFKGIFDEAHQEVNKDKGQILQKKLTPAIMVSTIPDGLTAKVTKIKREGWITGDKIYTVSFIEKDEEGIPYIWLF